MNLQETLQLLEKLNSVGATQFKSPEFQIELRGPANEPPKPVIALTEPLPTPSAQQVAENTRKAEALIDLLKRKDEEILNQIFPEGA